MEGASWFQVLDRLGVAVGALIFISLSFWKCLQWAASNVVEPLVKSHRDLIEKLGSSIEEISETQEAQATASEKRQVLIEEIHRKVMGK